MQTFGLTICAVDTNGKILVVDLAGDKLIRIEPSTGAQTVLAQGGLLAGVRSIEVFGGTNRSRSVIGSIRPPRRKQARS